jgi:hypothetical protein
MEDGRTNHLRFDLQIMQQRGLVVAFKTLMGTSKNVVFGVRRAA